MIEDVSKLTSISERALKDLLSVVEDCICHEALENIIERNSLIPVDIGVGTLYIYLEGEDIKYKFIPSKRLEEKVTKTLSTKQSPLVASIDSTLKERIERLYKQMLL